MTTGGITVNVAGTVLSDMGTGIDVLGQLPRVDVKGDGQVSVFGCGTPLIYINNRPIQSNTELQRLKSSDIKSIDVLTSPGARYKKDVSSVIRIHTIKQQGDGFSVSSMTNVRNNHDWGGYQDINVKYRTRGLELFAEGYWRTSWMGEDNTLDNDLFLEDGMVHVDQTGDTKMRSKSHYEQVGFNYDINDNHSLGASYTLSGVNTRNGSVTSEQQIWNNGTLEGRVMQDALFDRKRNPLHDANMYYMGKVGRLTIDFNGTWYCGNDRNTDERVEWSDELDGRHVLTQSRQRNRMTAGKLILSHPLWKGTASIGTELTFTRTSGTYSNDDQSHLSSDTRIRENNSAGFAEYDFTLGNLTFGAGLRFEHINSDYYSSGVREAEPSRTYNDWFPNASVAWKKDKWNWQLNYSRRINRPSYFQLRNFIQYDNRYTYEGGNPLLRPQLNHRLELSAIYSWLSLQVRYTYSQSTMCWVPVLEQDKRYALLCTHNYGDAQRLFASLVAVPRFGVYRPTVTLSFNKVFFDAEQYGSRLTHHRPLWRFELRNTFVLPHSWTAVLGVRFASDADDEFQSVKHYWTVGARINKSFFNKALLVNLYAEPYTHCQPATTRGVPMQLEADVNAVPASSSRTALERPPMEATICTSSDTPSAPMKAQTPMALTPRALTTPSSAATVAPSVAPEEIPRMYGSARGLRTMACMTQPDTDSAMPIPTAMITLGSRTNHTISCSLPAEYTSGSPRPKNLYIISPYTSPTLSFTEPKVTAARMDKTSSASMMKMAST